MERQDVKKYIAGVIREELIGRGLTVKRMVLFGSQAQGSSRPDSDWDFLVSIDKELEFWEKAKISTVIQRQLARHRISADIIIKSEGQILNEQNNVCLITYYALKHGVSA